MWKLAAATGIGAALCWFESSWERKHFVTENYEISSPKIREERRLVFLSDLHDNCFGPGQKILLEEIDRIKPDAVLIGGDMMVVKRQARLSKTLFLARKLAGNYPVYYGNGNHENRMDRKRKVYGDKYDLFVRELEKAGVCHLSDTSVALPGGMRLSGLNLEKRHYKKRAGSDLEVSYIEKHLGASEKEGFQILLAHSPLYGKTYARWGADLTLSGHFHGGTIRIPGMGGLMTPQFHFFLDCCGGRLEIEDKTMIVSRGLGTHSINIRLNNRPELTVIRLRPSAKTTEERAGKGT